MEQKDISAVHKLLTEYLKHFHLTPIMSREEVEHWFLPQENIIDTFVVEVREQGQDRGGGFLGCSLGRRVGGGSCCRVVPFHPGLPHACSQGALGGANMCTVTLAKPLRGSKQALMCL